MKKLKCPHCGHLHRLNYPAVSADAETGGLSKGGSSKKSRELYLWLGFAAGLSAFAVAGVLFVNQYQRNIANRGVSQNIVQANALLAENRHEDAIRLLEESLEIKHTTESTNVRKLIDDARVKKIEFEEIKLIEANEHWLNQGEIERAVTLLKANAEKMNGANKVRAIAIIENVESAGALDVIAAELPKFLDEELKDDEKIAKSLTEKFVTTYPPVREKFRQNVLACLSRERARREEIKRRDEAEQLAKLEQERQEKRQERLAREIAEQEADKERIGLAAKAESERLAMEERLEREGLEDQARLAEKRKDQEMTRKVLEERRKRSFAGIGQKATRTFFLAEGLAVVKLRHVGTRNFIVKLFGSDGNFKKSLVNEIGSGWISRAIRIPESGEYLLNVVADGQWEIVIFQPLPHETDFEFFFSGQCAMATKQFKLSNGLCRIKLKHRGQGNFIVRLLDDQGELVDSVVNEIGNFNGSQVLRIGREGTYIFDVYASGSWSIEIE